MTDDLERRLRSPWVGSQPPPVESIYSMAPRRRPAHRPTGMRIIAAAATIALLGIAAVVVRDAPSEEIVVAASPSTTEPTRSTPAPDVDSGARVDIGRSTRSEHLLDYQVREHAVRDEAGNWVVFVGLHNPTTSPVEVMVHGATAVLRGTTGDCPASPAIASDPDPGDPTTNCTWTSPVMSGATGSVLDRFITIHPDLTTWIPLPIRADDWVGSAVIHGQLLWRSDTGDWWKGSVIVIERVPLPSAVSPDRGGG